GPAGGPRRPGDPDGRGHGRGRPPPPAPTGVRRARRRPVRLLHAGHPRHREGAPRRPADPHPPGDQGSARGQPLPLHGLHEDPRRRRARVAQTRPQRVDLPDRRAPEARRRRPDGKRDRPQRVDFPERRAPEARRRRPDGKSDMTKQDFSIIGQPLPKIDAWAKVVGETKYADDFFLPRMAYGRLLRSPHGHALIKSIDVSRARELPGVYAVITGADLPRVKFGILPVSQDEE